jgi:hypothetical protein
MSTSSIIAPGQLSSLACSPDQDAACGLEYAAPILESGGIPDVLSASEAPRLVRAAGGRLLSHAALQGQIDEAARVVATQPGAAPIVQRVRETTNTLAEPPREPIPSRHLNLIATLCSIIGTVLGILPVFGVFLSPWIAVGVLGAGLCAFLLQIFNDHMVAKNLKRARSDHEDAILALLRRADEMRSEAARRARRAAHVSLDAPAT